MAIREDLLDLLLKPPVRGPISYICCISRASTTGDQGNNTTSPVKDDGTRISLGREGALLPVMGQDANLNGCVLDAMVTVDASERLKPIGTTYSGACGQAILHNNKCLIAMDIKVLGLADFITVHNAKGLEESIIRVLIVCPVLKLWE